MHSSMFARSTAAVVWGFVLLVLGTGASQIATNLAFDTAFNPRLYGDPDTTWQTWSVIGTVLTLVGIVILGIGLFRLASNVDLAGHRAAKELEPEERAQAEARAAQKPELEL